MIILLDGGLMHKYKEESIYIAGPECFYPDGFTYLASMRREAEYYGFRVTLPNDNPLKTDQEDLQKNADAIFENCKKSMSVSTAIIADLETFRGAEPDGGTVYEIGMAYALGLRCYAYTRDKRDAVHKYQGSVLEDGNIYDRDGRLLPYPELPFSPCIVGSSKIIEGDFGDCLKLLMTDIDEERKCKAKVGKQDEIQENSDTRRQTSEKRKPLVYLACSDRYDQSAEELYAVRKEICSRYGFEVITPLDEASGNLSAASDDPYAKAYQTFDRWQQHVRSCDIILADLNDFHGMEPNSDVAFECGMAWQLGKKCFGYMDDTTVMRKRIPHYGGDKNYKDICGYEVENFNYPVNLMFASSMPVLEGDFEAIVKRVSELLDAKNRLL
jgi:nucleoside 2-deoxyribosyltransferase